ncbi:MAG: type I 3-dehydroquinate dehydratase [Spirochaetia bacterium]
MKDRTAICLCLAAKTIEADLRIAEEHRGRYDLLELRVDRLNAAEAGLAGRLPGLVECPVILTLRRTREGGEFAGDERERRALLGKLADAAFAYIDLEEDLDAPELEGRVTGRGGRIIRSLHDFTGVPAGLARRVAGLAHRPGEIPKAALLPKSASDLARLLAAFESLKGVEKILLGMGEIGFPTRVLAPKLGSFLCYASAPHAQAAPGHVDPLTLESTYNFRAITPGTRVYGVIGSPVLHSLSPLIHNRGFAALGIDAVYLPFLVDDLDGFWEVADSLEIRGLSVTVPHKQAVIPRLAGRDPLVEATGACNTMTRAQGRGPWQGTNTDVDGFLAPLRAAWGGAIPRGISATVIGAGGAARAVVRALKSCGARVLVLNRTTARGGELAAAFSVSHAGLDADGFQQAKSFSDLIVQTTSAGMTPDILGDPAPGLRFSGKEIVYELLYAPPTTAFLQRALDAGCRVVRGRQMLIGQAMEQFRLFTGSAYPAHLKAEFEADMD